jgi:peroxiredoxin
MKKFPMSALLAAVSLVFVSASSVHAAPAVVGQAAPGFSVTDTHGKSVSLADFKGKTVVLEWVNPGCPFVVKHYGAGNMQATQKDATAKGVVWLAVNTTSNEHRDYLAPAAMGSWMVSQKAGANATLMDTDGKLGRAYGAKTTPHMYIIDSKGQLVFAGGIDNKPTANPADIPGAKNFVNAALAEVLAGKAVSEAQTRPYGCSVKYGGAG